MPHGQTTDASRRHSEAVEGATRARVLEGSRRTGAASRRVSEAVLFGNIDRVREALRDGRHPDQALRLAAGFGKADIVDLLLEAGASAAATGVHGTTALTASATVDNPEIVQRLIETPPVRPLHHTWERS